MRIAILGTRGIPNHYGGFEQCAENLSLGLMKAGHDVIVYNSHNHAYQKSEWNNIHIVHQKDPEYKWGTLGQFVYDFNCILDVRKRNCDIILQLGYTSSSIWGWLLPKKPIIFTNMDGLEWKRTKYSNYTKKFLKYAERLAVFFSDCLICDSIGIKNYIDAKFGLTSTYIPYGANLFNRPDIDKLNRFSLCPYGYDLLIARLEPENSVEIVLDGVVLSGECRPFLVIGNHETTYGRYLKTKYRKFTSIRFLGAIYDIDILNNIRYFSNLYFHGHTVGGTNPSLLDAMACSSLISAHNNCFNKYILGNDALYFSSSKEISQQLLSVDKNKSTYENFLKNNYRKIDTIYSWKKVVSQYEKIFKMQNNIQQSIQFSISEKVQELS